MWSINRFLYILVDPLFYEWFGHYVPDEHSYVAIVKQMLSSDWNVTKGNLWFHCAPVSAELPSQGWKIHVSATTRNAPEVLEAVVPVLRKERVAFKFAADQHILRLLVSKQWPRGSAGKFITIYP